MVSLDSTSRVTEGAKVSIGSDVVRTRNREGIRTSLSGESLHKDLHDAVFAVHSLTVREALADRCL
jgi:hypothetical protein